MTATSTEQRTASSCAFLNRPPFRFRNVTERLRSSLMALISIFLRPILDDYGRRMRAGTEGLRRASGLEVVSRVLPATWKIQATRYQSKFSHAVVIRSYSQVWREFWSCRAIQIAKRKRRTRGGGTELDMEGGIPRDQERNDDHC